MATQQEACQYGRSLGYGAHFFSPDAFAGKVPGILRKAGETVYTYLYNECFFPNKNVFVIEIVIS
jgi:hypothetical protein